MTSAASRSGASKNCQRRTFCRTARFCCASKNPPPGFYGKASKTCPLSDLRPSRRCLELDLRSGCLIEDHTSVICQEVQIWQRCVFRKVESLPRIFSEVLLNHCVCQLVSQSPGQHQPQVIVKGNQSPVKSSIVKARQAKAVAHIQPLCRIRGPWEDVRSHEQLADGQLRHATTAAKIVEH